MNTHKEFSDKRRKITCTEKPEKTKHFLFDEFKSRTHTAINELRDFVFQECRKGKRFAGLGASTKGNVILQAAGFGPSEIQMIGDVNSDKEGCFTPGTFIPIVTESFAISNHFDYYIVFPWHFRDFFLSSSTFENLNLVFPLPQLEVILRG